MYQIVHGASGLLIGSQTGNPWLALILGLASHFILDAIPHDSIEMQRWQDKGSYTKKIALEAIFDLWLLAILILVLQSNNYLSFNWVIVFAMVGSLLPDYLWGLPSLFKIENKWVERYKEFHDWTHAIFHKPMYLPAIYAIPIQLIALVIIVAVYLLLL